MEKSDLIRFASDDDIKQADKMLGNITNNLKSLKENSGFEIEWKDIFGFLKDSGMSAAAYETASNRINVASGGLTEGKKNLGFITSEVEKFKLPLQESIDTFGNFLLTVQGSGVAGESARKLYDNLLLISKVHGWTAEETKERITGLGQMLAEDSFNPELIDKFPGLHNIIAKDLGVKPRKLSQMEDKLEDPQIFLKAINEQATGLAPSLSTSLNSLQSGINGVTNSYGKLQTQFVGQNREAYEKTFSILESGFTWLSEHADVFTVVGGLLVGAKAVSGAVNVVKTVSKLLPRGAGAAAEVAATEGGVIAAEATTGAVAGAEVATSTVVGAEAGVLGTEAGAAIVTSEIVGGGVITGELAGTMAASALIPVVGEIVLVAGGIALLGYGIKKMLSDDEHAKPLKLKGGGFYDSELEIPQALRKKDPNSPDQTDNSAFSKLPPHIQANLLAHAMPVGEKAQVKPPVKPVPSKIVTPQDQITGQRVIAYNISIKEINGIKQNTVTEGGTMDIERTATQLKDIIISIVNDSQLKGND